MSKLELPAPEFPLDQMLKEGKLKLIEELKDKYTPEQIKEELEKSFKKYRFLSI